MSDLDNLIAEAERLEPSFNEYGWPETFRALLAAVKSLRNDKAKLREFVDNAWRGIETDLELLNVPRVISNEVTALGHLAGLARAARDLMDEVQP